MYSLPYGKTHMEFDLPSQWHVSEIHAPSFFSSTNPAGLVSQALAHPVGEYHLDQFIGRKSVAIAINDKTRPIPHEILLPPLLEQLRKMGFEPRDITLIIATGTHLPMKSEEFGRILPQEISQRYTVLSHDCDDAQNLVFTGKTAHGTEVWVNRDYAQAELKIVLGNIEPHHFMGFSGGVKSASIGLTGRKTIDQNHSFLLDPESKIAAYETNPMRMDVEDIGKLIGVDFALNIILAPDKKVASVLAGQPERVMETGIPIARSVCQVKVPQKYDLVIASVGGYPKDLNLYQSQKAVTNAAMITREGGVVILAAECPEGSGSKSYEDFMQGVVSYDGVFEKFKRNGFRVGPHKAIQFARIGQKAHLVLVSTMNPDLVRQLLLDPAASMDNALEIARAYLNKEIIDVALMPHAPTTVPDLD